jgi:hypothetical protein
MYFYNFLNILFKRLISALENETKINKSLLVDLQDKLEDTNNLVEEKAK